MIRQQINTNPVWRNAKWKYSYRGYRLINPHAVISLPHPLIPTFHSLFLSFIFLPPFSRTTIGKLSEAELIVIRYLLFFFFPSSNQHLRFGETTNEADRGGFRYGGGASEVWGGQEGDVPLSIRDKNRLHPAVSQDVHSVWAASVSHLPQHNFSFPSYKYTEKLHTKDTFFIVPQNETKVSHRLWQWQNSVSTKAEGWGLL